MIVVDRGRIQQHDADKSADGSLVFQSVGIEDVDARVSTTAS